MRANRTLDRIYSRANRLYFGNRLPGAIVGYGKLSGCVGQMELVGGEKPVICLSKSAHTHPCFTTMTIYHEMCHLAMYAKYGKRGGIIEHGPKFQAEMLRLAKAGAFRNHW